jgi:hypothetical protein
MQSIFLKVRKVGERMKAASRGGLGRMRVITQIVARRQCAV